MIEQLIRSVLEQDIYVVALRDPDGCLIGYYEKIADRNADTAGLYYMP